jgi:hypothetical protein
MKKETQELIDKILEEAKQDEIRIEETLNDENIPQDLKDSINKIREKIEKQRIKDNEYIEANKGKKILRYNLDTFLPIFEQ